MQYIADCLSGCTEVDVRMSPSKNSYKILWSIEHLLCCMHTLLHTLPNNHMLNMPMARLIVSIAELDKCDRRGATQCYDQFLLQHMWESSTWYLGYDCFLSQILSHTQWDSTCFFCLISTFVSDAFSLPLFLRFENIIWTNFVLNKVTDSDK